jgi:hypothetical protein
VAEALLDSSWTHNITGTLTVQVIPEYLTIWEMVQPIQLTDEEDKFLWRWTTDQQYSASSSYKALFIRQSTLPGAKILRKIRAPPKCKFFGWLVLHDRRWTAHWRFRHNLQDQDVCALCDQDSETLDNLFVWCSYSREVWPRLLLQVGLQSQQVSATTETSFVDWWTISRKRLPKDNRKTFSTFVLLAIRLIRKERNGHVFDRKASMPWVLAESIHSQGRLWTVAGFLLSRDSSPLAGL